MPPAGELNLPDEMSYQHLRSVTGIQPKSSKLPPLVSEFRTFIDVGIPTSSTPPVAPGECLTEVWQNIPARACLLKKPRRLKGGITKMGLKFASLDTKGYHLEFSTLLSNLSKKQFLQAIL